MQDEQQYISQEARQSVYEYVARTAVIFAMSAAGN